MGGLTPLHHAIDARRPKRLRALLSDGGDATWASPAGWSLLHYASQQDASAEVTVLLDAGALVNAADRVGNTPLHVAARAGQLAVVDVLLARGANAAAVDCSDNTPLTVAIKASKEATVDRLLTVAEKADIHMNLVRAVSGGETAVVEKLLAHGADPNFVTPRGNSALGVAKKKRNKAIEALLVAKGARVQAKASVHRTVPLAPAIATGNVPTKIAATVADLTHATSARRRRAASQLEKIADARATGALVPALAAELTDKRTWEPQVAMARALGACTDDERVLAWLKEVIATTSFEATAVPRALADAAGRIALRCGEELPPLLDWSLGVNTTNEQRLAAVAGILNVVGEHTCALDEAVRAKVERLLEAPGTLSGSDAMWDRAKEAFAALSAPEPKKRAAKIRRGS